MNEAAVTFIVENFVRNLRSKAIKTPDVTTQIRDGILFYGKSVKSIVVDFSTQS